MFCNTNINFVRMLSNMSVIQRSITRANLHYIGTRAHLFGKSVILERNGHIRQNSFFRMFIKKESPEKLKVKDNVPDSFELIYRNKMNNYLFGAQVASTVLAGALGLAFILSNNSEPLMLQTDFFVKQVGSVDNEIYIYMSVFIAICVLLQLYVSRMPLRIYNYPKQNGYILIFYGALPGTTKRLSCAASEVVKLEKTGILPWNESTYQMKDQHKIILIENYFRTPADLNIMLGYQKHRDDE